MGRLRMDSTPSLVPGLRETRLDPRSNQGQGMEEPQLDQDMKHIRLEEAA